MDRAQEAAAYRMQARGTAESVMAQEGQQNAGGTRRVDRESGRVTYDSAPLTEYPRMMYRQTEHEQVQEGADALVQLADKPNVINRFDGYLCDMCIAHSATEAEALAELGWETSPAAAYGVTTGIGAAVTAKDERIAELERMLAERDTGAEQTGERRGPGRPRKAETEPA